MADVAEERSQNETVYVAALEQVCATFGVQTLHEEQRKAIDTFFEGKDVFVSLPTGYGKSVIFQAIPVIASILSKKPCTIFVVSPLKALMDDQVQYLNSLGLKAIALSEQSDDSILERVMNGEFSHVYGSPESFLATDMWRDVFNATTFKTRLVGVAIDEAHCISHWYVVLVIFCSITKTYRSTVFLEAQLSLFFNTLVNMALYYVWLYVKFLAIYLLVSKLESPAYT